MKDNYTVEPIAKIFTGFSEKFGIPRQSGLVDALRGKIVFEKKYRDPDALRGIEGFSHLWLIWRFSEAETDVFHPTVRPPRLGGNTRVGVFASRSPFRPNSLGLSCVKLESVDFTDKDAPVIYVSGIDMLDGTPIIDIKPYIPVADLVPEAKEGYTKDTRTHMLGVTFCDGVKEKIPDENLSAIIGILENDPRPGYADDPQRVYTFDYRDISVSFTVNGDNLTVVEVKKQ